MLEEGIFDIHCHIVPGVDDGAADIEESRKLLEMEYKQGVRNIILTPHFRFQMFMEMLPMLREKKVATMAGSRYVLVEFSHNSEASYIRERLSAMLSGGYRPIVAHIERYEATRTDLDFVEELTEMGAYMQINADSIVGKCGFFTKRYCQKLMKNDLVHFVGSDCHDSSKRISRIGEAYSYVIKKMDTDYAKQLFIRNPQKIIDQKI